MAGRLSRFSSRSPRLLLAGLALLAAALCLFASGVPERLALGGGSLAGSSSERVADDLAAELGYDPAPTFLVLLTGESPISAASSELALETLTGQIESIDAVGTVMKGRRTSDDASVTLAVHLAPDLDPGTVLEVEERLRTDLDPGPLALAVGGTGATEAGTLRAALDDAPRLLALVTPLLLLLLAGSFGLRAGLAALLGLVLAAAATVSALGLVGELATIQASAVVPAAVLAALLAAQTGAGLLIRYRDEAPTLGAGPEAIEYSLHLVLKGAAISALSAGAVGIALLLVPIGFVQSTGAALIAAALLGPLLGLLPMLAVVLLRPGEHVHEALPLVSEGAREGDGPVAFRALVALGGARRRGLVALLPLLAIAALAVALGGSQSIGLAGDQLPVDSDEASAEAQIAAAFGPGAAAPLLVATDGAGGAPTVTIYRDAIDRVEGVASVGPAQAAGSLAGFDVVTDSLPQSLAAQATATDVRAVPSPSPSGVGGSTAELDDASERLGADLPLFGLLTLLAVAVLWGLLFRSRFGPMLAFSALLAPLAGLAAMEAVFSDGLLTGPLDYDAAGAAHLQSFVIVGAVLFALGLSRGAEFATALREERTLGGGAAGSLARSGLLTLLPAAVAGLAGALLAAVWVAGGLLPGKEIGLGLAAGLLADLLLARTILAPGLARISL